MVDQGTIAVFGGGVAGLTVATALSVRGRSCRVYERRPAGAAAGMGIVLAAEALASLVEAGVDNGGEPPAGTPSLASLGVELGDYHSYQPDGERRQTQEIPAGWRCVERTHLIEALLARLPAGTVRNEAALAELTVDAAGTVTRARLTGGEVCADLYVAADGANSLARRALYPHWPQRRARVRELVGIVRSPRLSDWAGNDLHKFRTPGVAIGIAPVGDDTVGWFLQFDSDQFSPPDDTVAARAAFATRLVGGWAEPVRELLRTTDFARTHLWHPIDADLVPRFHTSNLVLVGDAAHPLLPFTSQGVGAAICGARDLVAALDRAGLGTEALAAYSRASRTRCLPYVSSGRELTDEFLAEPADGAAVLPLAAGASHMGASNVGASNVGASSGEG